MAAQLIDRYTGSFEAERHGGTYRDTLCDIIKAKRKAQEVKAEARPAADKQTDWMAALRACKSLCELSRRHRQRAARLSSRVERPRRCVR